MDGHRVVRASTRGVLAAVVGGVVGAVLTRALMRVIMVVAGGQPAFTWTGTAFIALFYVVFLLPGAIALAWSRAGWPLFLFGVGAIAIPVQAAGIATTDLADVGPFSPGQWAILVALFLAMAGGYFLQAAIVYRVARSGRRDGQREAPTALVGAGGREALG
jgi:hypothetical protein